MSRDETRSEPREHGDAQSDVIWATAQVHQCLLVTRNTRDFDANDPGVRVPYVI
jgi:hypothetical protein